MGKRSGNYQEYLIEKIKDPKEREAYIESALEDDDPMVMLAVLRNCAEAMGGMSKLARESHLTRAALIRMFKPTGNPKFGSLTKILPLLGYKLKLEPIKAKHKKELMSAY